MPIHRRRRRAGQTLAEKSDHPEATPEHMLKALLEQEGGVVPSALAKLGANSGGIARSIDSMVGAFQGLMTPTSG